MRKILLMLVFVLGGILLGNAYAQSPQNIPMQIIRQGGACNGNTLAPPHPWYITQLGHVLTLPATPVDYTLELWDDDEIVYYTYLPAGTTQVIIPSTITGEFEIRLVADTYYYRGFLTL